ncbi:ribonuclease [Ciceribacter sp. L1K23]|nr:ribonuclease [Ciceribacter sp. L1K23]
MTSSGGRVRSITLEVLPLSDQPLRRLIATLATFFVFLFPVRADQHREDLFDFFVLSLSWSPTYCLSEEGQNNRQQCGLTKRHGFVVHGLWPQYERGYPEFCTSPHPGRVPDSLGRRFFDIMPSMGLIGHQWRKHGTCSGLSQEQYLETTRRAFEALNLPENLLGQGSHGDEIGATEIEDLFVAANPGLLHEGIAVACDGQRVKEVRICLTSDLRFRECHQVDTAGCKASSLTLPPIR